MDPRDEATGLTTELHDTTYTQPVERNPIMESFMAPQPASAGPDADLDWRAYTDSAAPETLSTYIGSCFDRLALDPRNTREQHTLLRLLYGVITSGDEDKIQQTASLLSEYPVYGNRSRILVSVLQIGRDFNQEEVYQTRYYGFVWQTINRFSSGLVRKDLAETFNEHPEAREKYVAKLVGRVYPVRSNRLGCIFKPLGFMYGRRDRRRVTTSEAQPAERSEYETPFVPHARMEALLPTGNSPISTHARETIFTGNPEILADNARDMCRRLLTGDTSIVDQIRLLQYLYGIQIHRSPDDFRVFAQALHQNTTTDDYIELIESGVVCALKYGKKVCNEPDYQRWYTHFMRRTLSQLYHGLEAALEAKSVPVPSKRPDDVYRYVDEHVRQINT